MALSMSGCEELDAPRCGAPQVARGTPARRPARLKVGLGMPDLRRDAAADRDEADAGDKATRRVAPQPAQAASSVLTDAPHRSATSSLPNLDCNTMKSLDNFQNGLIEHAGMKKNRFRIDKTQQLNI